MDKLINKMDRDIKKDITILKKADKKQDKLADLGKKAKAKRKKK